METNPHLKSAVFEIIDNQLNNNIPPETKQTFNRLINEGHSEEEAKKLIGCVIVSEMFDILKKKEEFNSERFLNALNKLPQMPWE